MFKTLILATALTLAADKADKPLPRPVSATEVVVCQRAEPVILVMILTFADGTVVRFDADHMHGMTVQQLVAYASLAKDTWSEGERGCGITT